jgi:hypothetical protein
VGIIVGLYRLRELSAENTKSSAISLILLIDWRLLSKRTAEAISVTAEALAR